MQSQSSIPNTVPEMIPMILGVIIRPKRGLGRFHISEEGSSKLCVVLPPKRFRRVNLEMVDLLSGSAWLIEADMETHTLRFTRPN